MKRLSIKKIDSLNGTGPGGALVFGTVAACGLALFSVGASAPLCVAGVSLLMLSGDTESSRKTPSRR